MKEGPRIDDRHHDDDLIRIAWYLPEDGDFGATLGEGGEAHTAADLASAPDDDRDFVAACIAAAALRPERDEQGYYWESRSAAADALRAINAAIKADRDARKNRPWPEWATRAAAAGWRPPRGWAPPRKEKP